MAMDFMTRTIRYNIKNDKISNSKVFKIIRWIVFNTWLNVFVCNFKIKYWNKNWYFSESLYHLPALILIISFILCLIYKLVFP